jgi:hypothetical protein
MKKLVKYRRVLIGVSLVVMLALVVPVSLSELPAGMAVIGVEACIIGVIALVLGFVAQLALRDWELRDRLLLLCAVIVALAFRYWGHAFSGMGPRRTALNVVFFVLLLTWFGSLGAASARALRRNRRAKTLAPTSEA